MKIRVLFFAELKDAFGPERTMEVPQGFTVRDMTVRLTGLSRLAAVRKESLVYAVNENFENSDKVLNDGDDLAIMTPMSGG